VFLAINAQVNAQINSPDL